ncbi:MAG: SMC-Scp complex subunit ScpB [Pseudomonadota bacterium]|nr:SMC-Scp complex subunit ScpB [Pseudomonadota bacterium]
MEHIEIKKIIDAALLAAGCPLSLDKISELFGERSGPDRKILREVLDELARDYEDRGIELKEVASGYRIQIKSSMADRLVPLWEEKAPRYSRALLETLSLIAYRQPITRGEIEDVRGVAVTTNIIRTLLERGWVRVVGHRDVPGRPAMFATTSEFLDYFGMKKLDDLPPLSEIKELVIDVAGLELSQVGPQADLIDSLEQDDQEPELLVDGTAEKNSPN